MEATSPHKSKALIARYMNRMDLGHHLRAAEQVTPENSKLDRALGAVLDRLQLKLGPRMYVTQLLGRHGRDVRDVAQQ